MRAFLLAAAVGLTALAGSAIASPDRQTTTYVCLTPGGSSQGVTCRRALNGDDDFCTCPGSSAKVKAAVCRVGEAAPAESAAYERARRHAARDGSLIGDSFEGKAMCVRPDTSRSRGLR